MKNTKKILQWGILGGVAESLYILLIALFFMNAENVLPEPPAIMGSILMLILIVFSVAISGLFVFGYPALLAIRKDFKEAIWTVATTLITLLVIFAILFTTMYFV